MRGSQFHAHLGIALRLHGLQFGCDVACCQLRPQDSAKLLYKLLPAAQHLQ
jgi:hypothetical protein